MKYLTPTYWLALSLLLASCASQPPRTTNAPLNQDDWAKHQADINAITQWQAVGKLGVKVPNDGGTLSLRWEQQGAHYQIHFNSPLGQNVVTIEGDDSGVTLSEAGQSPLSAKTAEELILKNTGWTIPVTQLAFWVRGLPAPHEKITRLTENPQGLLGELQQLGWTVTYTNYQPVTHGSESISMPQRITAQFKDIRLTLAIREWALTD